MKQSFVIDGYDTPQGPVPRVSAEWSADDRRGARRVRWDIGRMDYTVAPGLYALGEPDGRAPVLVSANYKLSFDVLRTSLPGRSAWILVLETFGINVWCAAGKGTFGTAELVKRILGSGMDVFLEHHQVIVPQLGAVGVAAHEVKASTGYTVLWGPIRADDLPAYLDAGKRATDEMRQVSFTAGERLTLAPLELVTAIKIGVPVALALALVAGFGGPGGYLANVLTHGLFAAVALLGAVGAGAVMTPLLLPWLPGRAFSIKGAAAGALVAAGLTGVLLLLRDGLGWPVRLELAAWWLLIPAISAFIGMNFTGSSTYTSQSGVRKEMRVAVPLQIAAAVLGLGLWIGARWLA